MPPKMRYQVVIEDGPLIGTIIEPVFGFIGVAYPHRKSKDCYIPPMNDEKNCKTSPWHCCQPTCANHEFYGGMEELVKHLELHAGRSLKIPKKVRGGRKAKDELGRKANTGAMQKDS